MKIEIGMYCFNKTNRKLGIGKILTEPSKYNNVVIEYKNEISFVSTGNVVASHNIIDLIEPLDLMYIDIEPNDGHGGIVVPRIAETLNELNQWKKRFESGECKLVYITTHEQIKSMQYKVD